MMNLTFKKNKF